MAESRATWSFIGIAIGALALLMVLIHFWAGPFVSQPTLEEVVAKKAVAIRNATISALKGEDAPRQQERGAIDLDRAIAIAAATLGGVAIVLGVVGFATKEPLRVAGGAVVLGAGAIAFQFAALAIGAIVVAILIAAVLSQLGFD